MQIEKAAVAGTLESSDCMVTVEDGDGNIDLGLGKSNIKWARSENSRLAGTAGSISGITGGWTAGKNS